MKGPTADERHLATLRRSIALFRAFRLEQEDPEAFYRPLAEDSVRQLGVYAGLDGSLVVDVGGGPGWFADTFAAAGSRYLTVEADEGEFAGRLQGSGRVVGTALALPLSDDAADVCYSSNVLEHVPDPWTMGEEMLRVTRPGGLVVVAFTTWYGPWGGHETAPWHLVSGAWAARRYTRRTGHAPKNLFGRSLFPVTVGQALRWAEHVPGATLVRALPRYLPWWAWWVVRVPGVRELVTWNLMLVMQKHPR